jgi:hypothetical protein
MDEHQPVEDNPTAQRLWALMADWWQPPAELLGTLPGRGGGPALTYLGHSDTSRALTECDPFWTWEPMGYEANGTPALERDDKGNPVGLWAWLTVCGVRRPCYGSCLPGKNEAVKELIGDAIRNGAMRGFGVAGGLWSKADRPDENAPVDDAHVQGLIDAATEAGLSPEDARAILREVAGVSSSREVPAKRYEAVVAAFAAHKGAGARAAELLADKFDAEAA